eukprot:TRINITY_DN809_c0_g1_i8.p1 TRINITY_DN809_c0_g1~~TRINITY_DN809_c0_g1_i8.p1  ORF type:complete len:117 (+),score=5.91 TRINITY_DN809_c0_g1_i8:337-687(+)
MSKKCPCFLEIQNQWFDRLAKFSASINTLFSIRLARADPDREVVARANPKFARANSNREMVARAYPCPLERLHPESGSLELTSSSLERTLQKTQSGFLQLSLFFTPFSTHYHKHLQ